MNYSRQQVAAATYGGEFRASQSPIGLSTPTSVPDAILTNGDLVTKGTQSLQPFFSPPSDSALATGYGQNTEGALKNGNLGRFCSFYFCAFLEGF